MTAPGSAADTPSPGASPTPLPGARLALTLLLVINLFNFIDRQVLAAVLPEVEKTFFPAADPGQAPNEEVGAKLGSLTLAFMASYMVFAPLFGVLADRTSRWFLIGLGVLVWTLASGGSGLAATFGLLFLTRCLVGIGEAAYGPAAPTIISDLYPVKIRGSVLAWFYAAIPVGSALGYVLGGVVTQLTGDWRWAFYVVVPPGLLLSGWCFVMREPQRGQADLPPLPRTRGRGEPDEPLAPASGERGWGEGDESQETPSPPAPLPQGGEGSTRRAKWADYKVLLRTPSYVLCSLGMTAMTFAFGGLGAWMPYYISKEWPQGTLAEVNTYFGAILVVVGLAATLLGGIAGDKLRDLYPGSYFLVSGTSLILGFPLLLVVLVTPFPWAWPLIAVTVFCLFFNTGPTNTILANVTHPSIRATAYALNIFIIHALGDAVSPAIIGAIRDRYSLKTGFFLVSLMMLVGGVLWLWGARYLQDDTERAPVSLG